jgi:uncharacterized membrane protein YdbT with pleckstrin-like domain
LLDGTVPLLSLANLGIGPATLEGQVIVVVVVVVFVIVIEIVIVVVIVFLIVIVMVIETMAIIP